MSINSEQKNLAGREHLAFFICSGAYSGLSPIAPGTAGSVLAFTLTLCTFYFAPLQAFACLALALTIGSVVLGIFFGRLLLRSQSYQKTAATDPQEFVIDEFAGYFCAVAGTILLTDILAGKIFYSGINFTHTALSLTVVLFCFRLFDIAKPPPVSTLEQLPGIWGIMLDDLAAGIYAAILASAILSLL